MKQFIYLAWSNNVLSNSAMQPPILSFDFASFMEPGSMMSREHILQLLAKDHVVIHSTPALGRHITPPDNGFTQIFKNLYHFTNPRHLPHLHRFRSLNSALDLLRARYRLRLIRHLGESQRPILYLWHPHFSSEIGKYEEQLIVYHIYDDYSTLPEHQVTWRKKEEAILRKADLVFVANQSLLDCKQELVPRDYIYLPQGVDYSLFQTAKSENAVIPMDIQNIPTPRIGYIGRLNEKVDTNLVFSLASARPNWSFVFIGPIDHNTESDTSLGQLKTLPNVYFLGLRPFSEIAQYWLAIDVAVVPYKISERNWVQFGSPLKLREALAAGKPVVASNLDDLKSFGGLAHTATSVDTWLDKIQESLDSNGNPTIQQARFCYAKANSWEARVSVIQENIKSALQMF